METKKSAVSGVFRLPFIIPLAAILFWGERIFLWGALVVLFWVNVVIFKQAPQTLSSVVLPAVTNPFSITAHTNIAISLWNKGFQKTAKNELLLAQDLYRHSDASVLGTTTDPSSLLTQWDGKPIEIQHAYEYWKSVIAQKPDYRDGLIMTALYAHATGNTDEAMIALGRAKQLDPNFEPLKVLLAKLQN